MLKYYQTLDGYVELSNESPRGFKGVLFAGRGGPSPKKITEQAYGPNKNWVEIDADELPDAWFEAFLGYKREVDVAEDSVVTVDVRFPWEGSKPSLVKRKSAVTTPLQTMKTISLCYLLIAAMCLMCYWFS